MTLPQTFLPSGTLTIGANYWASHAGPRMWRDWDAEVVARDFAQLAATGIHTLRVFPLWPDFQPISALRGGGGTFVEVRFGEDPLPTEGPGKNGVSPEMVRRFGIMADLASANKINLIVGLVTGWMSGRLFVPPALDGLNPITDPLSILWQVRLVKTLVNAFKDHPAIAAWDLGNECNCMGAATQQQAWVWTATIADAIKSIDASRPVVSGMHSLCVEKTQPWSIHDQGELTDLLTTHPYPIFTPHCNREPMDTIRPLLHSSAETCLYADLSGKPAFVEEFGNFGPYVCGDSKAGNVLRGHFAGIWAHDCRAALWWCAFDQLSLTEAPHDWVPIERELGMLREEGSPKPLASEIAAFQSMLASLPFKTLPPRRTDAVCILTRGQDQWGAAYSSFILAKQAGFDIRFAYAENPLPDADLYLLPSIGGLNALTRRREVELRERVAAGATLYVSVEDAFVREVYSMTGLEFLGRCARPASCSFTVKLGDQATTLTLPSSTSFALRDGQATILAREENGTPVFSVAAYGKGHVYFLSVPLETRLATTNGAFLPNAAPYNMIYRVFAEQALGRRLIGKSAPNLGITEHPLDNQDTVIVLINHSPLALEDELVLSRSTEILSTLYGPTPESSSPGHFSIKLPANGFAVWLCRKN